MRQHNRTTPAARSAVTALFGFACTAGTCLVAAPSARAQATPEGTWEAGAATEQLVPPPNVIMGGYGTYLPPVTAPPRRSTGTHDPLQVSALATRGIRGNILVLAGIDAVGLRDSTVRRIEDALYKDNSDIRFVMCASHSHATPDSFGLWGALPNESGADPRYLEEIERKTIRAVQRAVASLRPARLSYADSDLPVTVADTPAPSTATWVWAEDAQSGQPIGRFTHWNAHPTLLPAENTLLSADYVGMYRAYSQHAADGGTPQIFCNGYLAAVYPVAAGEREDPFGQKETLPKVGQGIRRAAYVGHALSEAAEAARSTAKPMTETSSFLENFSTWIPITNSLFRILIRLGMIEGDLVRGQLLTRSGWFKWGPVQAVAIPGEPSRLVASWFTGEMAERGVEHTLVIGQAGGMTGYLLDPDTEFKTAAYKYQTTVSPSAEAAPALLERFRDVYWWHPGSTQ